MPRSLFRQEAIDAQRQKFLGEAGVAQPVRGWVYTVTAVAIAAIAVAVAVWGQYTRRERVQGFLSSAVGAAIVRMPDAGIVSDIAVREGETVKAGTPLAKLSVDRSGANDTASSEAVLRQLAKQGELLLGEREQAERLGQQQVDAQKNRIASLRNEVREAEAQIGLQSERLAQAKQLLDKWLDLQAKDYASDYYVLRYRSEVKDQEIRIQDLQRQRAALVKDLNTAQADLPSIQLRAQTQRDQLAQKSSEVEQATAQQELTRGQVKREMLVAAPIDGTVTNIVPANGQTVAADTQLATILPTGKLRAELLVPTRAIGFVQAGQPVTLRYDAFPYERFGQFTGSVESVASIPLLAGESVGPLTVHEPVYRIYVVVDRQDVAVGDRHFPLRAGMVASADLLMEKRSLLEWLFQPLLQLRERVRSGATTPA
jgi:membrane fusion protein